jgi:CubicO group peptidase (beta-lactamase class C family)
MHTRNKTIHIALEKKLSYIDGQFTQTNTIDNQILNMYGTFPIGSITKIFTVVMLLILHKNKLLDVHDNIAKYIGSTNRKNKRTFNHITILDVINHTSGLASMPPNEQTIYTAHRNIRENVGTFIDADIFVHPYGSDNYSNIGYILLGLIIEKVVGTRYDRAYKKYIFDPLGMTSTNRKKPSISLYSDGCAKMRAREKRFRLWGASAGGLCSCVADLVRFAKGGMGLLDGHTIRILRDQIYLGHMNSPRGDIGHSGKIFGAHTRFYFTHNGNELITIYIDFATCVGIQKDINAYYRATL